MIVAQVFQVTAHHQKVLERNLTRLGLLLGRVRVDAAVAELVASWNSLAGVFSCEKEVVLQEGERSSVVVGRKAAHPGDVALDASEVVDLAHCLHYV